MYVLSEQYKRLIMISGVHLLSISSSIDRSLMSQSILYQKLGFMNISSAPPESIIELHRVQCLNITNGLYNIGELLTP